MGDCVPDWDEMAGGTEVGISLENLEHLLKEKWDNVELSSQINYLASLSDHDVNQGSWGDTPLCTNLRAHLEHLDSQRASVCDAVTPSHPSGGKCLSSDLRKSWSGDGGTNINNPQEDELVSWLQPLEDPVEKEHHHSLTFSSPHDFHGDPGAACHLQQKGVSLHRMRQPAAAAASRDGGNPGIAFSSGAGGAVGVLPQGGELFNRFRTLEPVMPKTPCLERPSNVVHGPGSNNNHSHRVCSPRVSSVTATSAAEPVSEPASRLNFPHFSRPAALVKANLQSLGVSCIPTMQPLVRHNTCPKGSASASPLPFTLSARSGATNSGSPAEIDICRESSYSHTGIESEGEGSGDRASKQPSCAGSAEGNFAMRSCFPSASLTCDSNDKGLRTSSHEASEATFGSTSGGSGTSMVENVNAPQANMKRRLAEEDSEAPVDDAKDETVDLKKTAPVRTSATKRSRAAEVHNLSERRRRDRINEKMRALQDLIPNSNKTDKASMLDEAIAYLKMLQLHLQMMYVRTGMKIPPMILPPGLQAHESPVCAPDPNWGVSVDRGKAPGSGMGLGRMDVISPGQRPVPPFYGPTHVLGGGTADDQLQTTPLGAEAWNVCLSHQDAQPGNVDMYNTFMRNHQQQQQQFLHPRYYQR